VTDALISAFNALDITEAGRLDLQDVQFALRCVHLFATEADVTELALCAYEEVDHLSLSYAEGKAPEEGRLQEITKVSGLQV
jgi:hypothetical protein